MLLYQLRENVLKFSIEYVGRYKQKESATAIDIEVEDIETLGDVITNYDQIVAGMGHGISSNNAKFNEGLESIVDELFNK